MKLLFSALFVGFTFFCIHAQDNNPSPCSLDLNSYKVLVRKNFQINYPNLKFSTRLLKPSEICFIASIQDETEIVVHVLDARYEVVIYPSNTNGID